MAKVLDRSKRFGTIFGVDDHGATFTQGNHKFNNEGQEVGDGISPVVADPLRPGAAGPVATAPVEPAIDREEVLAALHPAQLKKLVEEAGLVAVGGAGSKTRNIAQLMALD